mmetsp:Transcript_12263/g.38845  ORF Transcript_12263/g.38845 Transcript_12263/m.38845 type:complete len:198 (+) Transcript_12263:170-763(+)
MSSDSAGSSEEGRPELFPSKHQVAGHRFEDGKRGSLVDGNGHFFKPLQAGPRGEREAAFYKRVSERTPESAYDDDAFEATSSSGEHEHNASTTLHVRLARWLARYHGTVQLEGKYGGGGLRHVELDDVTHRYKQPAIADIKVRALPGAPLHAAKPLAPYPPLSWRGGSAPSPLSWPSARCRRPRVGRARVRAPPLGR